MWLFWYWLFWGHSLFWGKKLVRSKNGYILIESYLDILNFIIKKFSPEINRYSKKVLINTNHPVHRYVLWCGGIFHKFLTFIQNGYGRTVLNYWFWILQDWWVFWLPMTMMMPPMERLSPTKLMKMLGPKSRNGLGWTGVNFLR